MHPQHGADVGAPLHFRTPQARHSIQVHSGHRGLRLTVVGGRERMLGEQGEETEDKADGGVGATGG